MKLIGLMPVRNEDWILGLSARAALMWCDELCVLLHSCSDNSWTIACDIWADTNRRLHAWHVDDFQWFEMKHRQLLLDKGRERGGTHFALIDADEILTGNMLPYIREWAEGVPDTYIGMILSRPLLNGISQYVTDGMLSRCSHSVIFKDSPRWHWAAREGGYDLHQRHPMGHPFFPHTWTEPGGVMHLQFASRRRLLAKQFLYQITERLRWPDRSVSQILKTYEPTVEESLSPRTADVPFSWWEAYTHLLQYLHVDREPWQEGECRRLLKEHPGIEAGLNDFGLLKEWGIK